jgi:hypothetical protein
MKTRALGFFLLLLCLWRSAFLLSAQGPVGSNTQPMKKIFRYNQYDIFYDRSSSADKVKYYLYPIIREAERSTPNWEHPLSHAGVIPGSYTTYDTLLTQASYIAVGDLETDGFKDVVSSSYYDGYIAILHQSVTTHRLELVALWDVTQGGSTNGTRDVFIEDMNADSLKDIVVFDVLNGLVAIFQQTNEYGVFVRTQVSTGMSYNRGGVGDLNNDGLADLIWTEGQSAYVAYQISNGFATPAVFSVPSILYGILSQPVVGDVNGDGRADLIVVDGYSNQLHIWESPNMILRTMGAPNNVAENVAVGDLDRDGIADIAIPGGGTNQVAITWGGVFTTTTLSGVGNLKDVAIGDINDDQFFELVATDQQSYHLVMWSFSGRIATLQVVPANVIPGEVVIADLNGDRLNDVAYGISGWTSPPHAPVTVHYQVPKYFLPIIMRTTK